jgi:hypothetical protein
MNRIYYILFSILFISSCHKKNTQVKESIIMGQTDEMVVTPMRATESDVDGDGTIDLRLVQEQVNINTSPQINMRITLVCLHENISILCQNITQTKFRTQVSTTSSTMIAGQLKPIKFLAVTESCIQRPNSTVLSTNNITIPVNLKVGELAQLNDNFMDESFIVKDVNLQTSTMELRNPPDTSILHIDNFNMDCNTVVEDRSNYFCFKLQKEKEKRLGWIVVAGTGTLTIRESAIAKEK